MPKNSNINIHTLNVNDIEQQLLSLSPATPQQMETALKVVEQIKSRKAALHLMQICIKQVEAMQANASEWAGLYYECLKLAARYGDFECFMLYIEKDRPADAKFYEPRRKSIHTIVEGLQALLDDELDELFYNPQTVAATLLVNPARAKCLRRLSPAYILKKRTYTLHTLTLQAERCIQACWRY